MFKRKTNVPVVNIDEQTYKLSDFCEEFKKFDCEEVKTLNSNDNGFKTIKSRVKMIFCIMNLKILFVLYAILNQFVIM